MIDLSRALCNTRASVQLCSSKKPISCIFLPPHACTTPSPAPQPADPSPLHWLGGRITHTSRRWRWQRGYRASRYRRLLGRSLAPQPPRTWRRKRGIGTSFKCLTTTTLRARCRRRRLTIRLRHRRFGRRRFFLRSLREGGDIPKHAGGVRVGVDAIPPPGSSGPSGTGAGTSQEVLRHKRRAPRPLLELGTLCGSAPKAATGSSIPTTAISPASAATCSQRRTPVTTPVHRQNHLPWPDVRYVSIFAVHGHGSIVV